MCFVSKIAEGSRDVPVHDFTEEVLDFLKMLFASIVLLGTVGVIFLPLFVALLGLRLLWETFRPPFPIMLSSLHLSRLNLRGVLDSQLLDELVCPLLPAILSADIRYSRSFHRSLVFALFLGDPVLPIIMLSSKLHLGHFLHRSLDS